jgi:hypothetical protein
VSLFEAFMVLYKYAKFEGKKNIHLQKYLKIKEGRLTRKIGAVS